MEPECQVKLEVFEGPLDLLLHLICKNKLEISDIPIALVTSQYLEYLDLMRSLDVVVAGEYLVMAATLTQIKSRMLLPRPDPPDPEDDPRLEIVGPLRQLMEARAGAEALAARPLLGRDVFVCPIGVDGALAAPGSHLDPSPSSEPAFEVHLVDLIDALRKVLGGRPLPTVLEIARARCSIAERMEFLSEQLSLTGRLRFFELFTGEDRAAIITTFLAVLELARLGYVRLAQEGPGGDILLHARANRDTPAVAVKERG